MTLGTGIYRQGLRDNSDNPQKYEEFLASLQKLLSAKNVLSTSTQIVKLGVAGDIFSTAGYALGQALGNTLGCGEVTRFALKKALSIFTDEGLTAACLTAPSTDKIGQEIFQGLTSRAIVQGVLGFAFEAFIMPWPLRLALTAGTMMCANMASEFAVHTAFNEDQNPFQDKNIWGYAFSFLNSLETAGIGSMRSKMMPIEEMGKAYVETHQNRLQIGKASLPKFGHLNFTDFETEAHFHLDRLSGEIDKFVPLFSENPTWKSMKAIEHRIGQLIRIDTLCDMQFRQGAFIKPGTDEAEITRINDSTTTIATRYQGMMATLFQTRTYYDALSGLKYSNNLSPLQKKLVNYRLGQCEATGIHLTDEKKAQYTELTATATQLQTEYLSNFSKGNNGHVIFDSPEEVATLDKLNLDSAWKVTEEGRIFYKVPVMSVRAKVVDVCDDPAVRQKAYEAFWKRCPDNIETLKSILANRQALAKLQGRDNYAEVAMEKSVFENPAEAKKFIADFLNSSRATLETALEPLRVMATADGTTLTAADINFYARRPANNVAFNPNNYHYDLDLALKLLTGKMGEIIEADVRPAKMDPAEKWDEGLRKFSVYDKSTGEHKADIICDLFQRDTKENAGYILQLVSGITDEQGHLTRPPVALMHLNFETGKSVINYNNMWQLAHDSGHGANIIYGVLPVEALSGITGMAERSVTVECASTIMEQISRDPDLLMQIAKHKETGEAPTREAIAAYFATTQVEDLVFKRWVSLGSLVDLEIHSRPNEDPVFVAQEVLDKHSLYPGIPPEFILAFPPLAELGRAGMYHLYMIGDSVRDLDLKTETGRKKYRQALALGSSDPAELLRILRNQKEAA